MSVTERRKRKSKWDQTTPGGPANSAPSSADASVSAAAAAARLNAMLEAQGKLQRQMPSSVAQNTSSFSSKSLVQTGDGAGPEGATPMEIVINDSEARGALTKGPTLSDINKATGAYVSVRGRYMTSEERASQTSADDRPLYLHIQGPNTAFINAAVQKIRAIMNEADNPQSASLQLPPPSLLSSQTYQNYSSSSSGHHYLQDKVFVGIDDASEEFRLLEKLQGPGGTFLGHIASTTGAKVFLRGKGSGYLEPTSGRESFEALYVYLSHPKSEGLSAARKLCENLIEHVKQEYTTFQRSRSYGGQQHYPAQPTGYNPYYQNHYTHSGQPPPPGSQVPSGYGHPSAPMHVPYLQQVAPPPPPGPLIMNQPVAPPPAPSQPVSVDGGYYNGGYCPPPPPPPPPGYGGPLAPMPGGPVPGPMPSFPPPPMVGPEKPFSEDFNSEPVYQTEPSFGPPPPQDNLATTLQDSSEATSTSFSSSSSTTTTTAAATTTTDIENLAYHQLPRTKSGNVNVPTPKRRFTEKVPTEPTAGNEKDMPISSSNGTHATITEEVPSRRFTERSMNSLGSIQPPSKAPLVSSPSQPMTSGETKIEESRHQEQTARETKNDDAATATMPPPSFNPRVSTSTMPPPSFSLRKSKRPSETDASPITQKKKPKAFALVAYGEDSSDSDTDS